MLHSMLACYGRIWVQLLHLPLNSRQFQIILTFFPYFSRTIRSLKVQKKSTLKKKKEYLCYAKTIWIMLNSPHPTIWLTIVTGILDCFLCFDLSILRIVAGSNCTDITASGLLNFLSRMKCTMDILASC